MAGETPKVVVIDGNDWSGLYVDGKLRMEGHSLGLIDVLKILEIDCKQIECDSDWLEEEGGFPQDFEDVKKLDDK